MDSFRVHRRFCFDAPEFCQLTLQTLTTSQSRAACQDRAARNPRDTQVRDVTFSLPRFCYTADTGNGKSWSSFSKRRTDG
jgi:hypothetical protein